MPYLGNMNTTFTTLTSSDANITDDLTVTDDASVGGDLTVTGNYTTTGGSTAMTIDANGHITKPLQPAFLAKVASQIDNMSVSGATNPTIAFGTEIFDQNADYNTDGTFTAPVAGRYQLSFFVRIENLDTAVTSYTFQINTSNRNYNYFFDPDYGDSDTAFYTATLSILADMDASDTAIVKYYQSGGTAQTDIDADSYFSGHLAC